MKITNIFITNISAK